MCWLGVHLEMDQWFKQTLPVRYLTYIYYVFIMICSEKNQTLCDVCVCVLTGLQRPTVWPKYKVVLPASVSDCSKPRLFRLLLFIFPGPSWYSKIPAIATTQVHLPTWVSPISAPASPFATQGHLPTWSSLVSVP